MSLLCHCSTCNRPIDYPRPRMLEPLGLTASDELVYRAVLAQPGIAAPELAALIDLTKAQTRSSLSRLETMGLVNRTGAGCYSATPPSPAIDILVRRRHEELDQLRLAAADLQALHHHGSQQSRQLTDIVEIVQGRAAVL